MVLEAFSGTTTMTSAAADLLVTRSLRGRACAFLLVSLATCAAPSFSQDETTRTVKIVADACAPGTTPASRDEALRLAREEAVWLWLEGSLGPARDEAFAPLMDYLDTYTASSRIMQVRAEGGRTCVEAEVFLYEWPLRTDAATVLIKTRRTPPSVAFLLIDNDAAAGARRFQENAAFAEKIVDAFRAKGFRIVPPASSRAAFGEREMLAILEAGPAATARFGSDLNADAVVSIEGRMSVRDDGSGTGTLRARAELALLVVSSEDAAVFDKANVAAEVTAADAPTGLEFALNDALYKIRDRSAVAAVLAARGTPADRFDLTIEGVRDLNSAERIAQGLRAFHGVSEADVLATRDGVARIRFQYGGKIATVVDFLEAGGAGAAMHAVRVVDHEMHFKLGS